MSESPIVITRSRRTESPVELKDFRFTREMIPCYTSNDFIRDYRLSGWEAFRTEPMPTQKDEAWRRTDLRSFKSDSFHLPGEGAHLDLPAVPKALLQPLVADQHGGQMVLMASGAKVSVSQDLNAKGVVFCDLKTAERQYPHLVEKILGKIVNPKEGKFAALAAALAQTGALVYVPKNVTLEEPLHSLLWGPGTNLAYISHLLVYLEEGASATYIHEAASPNEASGQTLHAGIVEIYVGPGARLRFVELQSWGEHTWNFSHERVRVDRDGNLDWIFGAIGSHLTKNFSELDLVGIGSTGKMSGFYFTDGVQHLDHDTQQNHMAPNTTSDLLFKGALLGESRSVWQGMIYVAPGAMKTNGYQANRNLVLSQKARADSIPGLEILADDVRCTHGATVGKIDEDLIFYLRSRGIPKTDAERLIVEGFFDQIMQRIPFEGVRERFQQAIQDKMKDLQG